MAWFRSGELEEEFKKKYQKLETAKQLEKAIEKVTEELEAVELQIQEDIRGGYPGSGHPANEARRVFLSNKLRELAKQLNDLVQSTAK